MWITIAQFFLSISILVLLHEWGHFATAKWFKTKVEKFYLFFNPGFSLFKYQKGETEYGIGWLPLGGYVKIAGMIDESFDKDQMKGEPQPWEFRSKPAWQRLIIMVGGVTVNFILGIALFAMILWIWGEQYVPNDEVKDGIAVSETAYEMGLRDGDKIISIGDEPYTKFSSGAITKNIIINGASEMKVLRDGKETLIPIDEKYSDILSKYENKNLRLVHLKFPAVIEEFSPSSPAKAEDAGLKLNDQILKVNGEETPYYHTFVERVMASESEQLALTVKRGNDTLDLSYLTLFPGKQSLLQKIFGKEAEKKRRIGFSVKDATNFYKEETQEYGFLESIPEGWATSWEFLTDQMKAFGRMFSGKIKAKESLGSFISIGKMFGTEWDWRRFWYMTASLSILLGFLNLLPIPALDGGYVMFLLFESITGIKVPDSVMEKATMIGFFILILLMIYALGLDISRLF